MLATDHRSITILKTPLLYIHPSTTLQSHKDTAIMSGSSAPSASAIPTAKATTNDAAQTPQPKPTTQLEEDDEFEDFPVEGALLH